MQVLVVRRHITFHKTPALLDTKKNARSNSCRLSNKCHSHAFRCQSSEGLSVGMSVDEIQWLSACNMPWLVTYSRSADFFSGEGHIDVNGYFII
jgi:hypothetical protein